jgi:hypothetical protein
MDEGLRGELARHLLETIKNGIPEGYKLHLPSGLVMGKISTNAEISLYLLLRQGLYSYAELKAREPRDVHGNVVTLEQMDAFMNYHGPRYGVVYGGPRR